jgi:Tfp pilus assembly protein PilP
MRFAKISRTLLLLALPAAHAGYALAQEHPNVQPSAIRDQLMKQTSGTEQTQPAAPAKTPADKPMKSPAKAPAKMPAKAPVQAPVKAPMKAPEKAPVKAGMKADAQKTAPKVAAAKSPAEKPAEEKPSVPHRDPFETLLNNEKPGNAAPQNLPPGKAGLVVSTLRIDGIVHGAGGMIAIVSNPQQRVYFLREGDKLYDGSIEHITLEAITFHEIGKDAFGKPLEREVTRRLYPSPGEQQ